MARHTSKRAKRVSRGIPKARRVKVRRLGRAVTRAEFDRLVRTTNERAEIVNRLRDAVDELGRASSVQFKRIAQIQADLDRLKQLWERTSSNV